MQNLKLSLNVIKMRILPTWITQTKKIKNSIKPKHSNQHTYTYIIVNTSDKVQRFQ